MNRLDKNTFLANWKVETDLFRQAVSNGEGDREVPSCPGWTVDVLTAHVSQGFRRMAERAVTSEAPLEGAQTDTAPAKMPADLLADFDGARQELANALESVALDAPAWNFAPLEKTARFWFRRVLLETAVHRWDAQMAAGHAEPVEQGTATEGITEIFDTFLPAAAQRDPADVSGLTRLLATDVNREWFVRMRSGRPALLESGNLYPSEMTVQCVAKGSASDLLLALWGRVRPGTLELAGNTELFDAISVK